MVAATRPLDWTPALGLELMTEDDRLARERDRDAGIVEDSLI